MSSKPPSSGASQTTEQEGRGQLTPKNVLETGTPSLSGDGALRCDYPAAALGTVAQTFMPGKIVSGGFRSAWRMFLETFWGCGSRSRELMRIIGGKTALNQNTDD